MEQPITNIQVAISIPPQRYMAAAIEIMSQYGDVVQNALDDIKKDLIFNKKFQNEVENEIKNQIRESVENAIKSAARRVVQDLYRDTDIEQMIENKILETMQKK